MDAQSIFEGTGGKRKQTDLEERGLGVHGTGSPRLVKSGALSIMSKSTLHDTPQTI